MVSKQITYLRSDFLFLMPSFFSFIRCLFLFLFLKLVCVASTQSPVLNDFYFDMAPADRTRKLKILKGCVGVGVLKPQGPNPNLPFLFLMTLFFQFYFMIYFRNSRL